MTKKACQKVGDFFLNWVSLTPKNNASLHPITQGKIILYLWHRTLVTTLFYKPLISEHPYSGTVLNCTHGGLLHCLVLYCTPPPQE